MKAIRGFSAHWTSYVDKFSSFGGYNNIGRRCRINESSIGKFTYFSADTKVNRAHIGAFCSIGQECIIGGLAKHPIDWLSTHPAFFSSRNQANYVFSETDQVDELGNVEIGNDVWIGARAIILDNCKIGHGAVIAAGAVVVTDIPPYAVVGGVPARVLKYRFSVEEIEILLSSKWWDLSLDELAKLKTSPPFIDALIEKIVCQ
jgi:acetyltransferase-like isoleucine patch superfamily enzyme